MGPNVKFVSAITDAFSNKKNGGQFFSAKKPNQGGVRGRFGKRPYFSPFFEPFPKILKFFVTILTSRGFLCPIILQKNLQNFCTSFIINVFDLPSVYKLYKKTFF